MTAESASRVFLHATNVHSGGGRSLLLALMSSMPANQPAIALLDTRMEATPHPGLSFECVKPTLWHRAKAELWLAHHVQPDDQVLCFGNLPPLFKLSAQVTVFLQNRYLVEAVELDNFPLKVRLRLMIEKLWLKHRAGNADRFVVQTPTMRALLESSGMATGKKIEVLPFVNSSHGYLRSTPAKAARHALLDFVYVASGEPHKNHRMLLEAWGVLARQGLRPSLRLTVDPAANAELCAWIDAQKARFGLNIDNLGSLQHGAALDLYGQARALIYPSLFESFGLPLIEARQAGLAIVASELDYVRDVVDAEEVFDPRSAISIARAVKRFLGASEPALPLMNAAEFVAHVFQKE